MKEIFANGIGIGAHAYPLILSRSDSGVTSVSPLGFSGDGIASASVFGTAMPDMIRQAFPGFPFVPSFFRSPHSREELNWGSTSYALNMNDPSAGSSPENPLVLDDENFDDSAAEEVEGHTADHNSILCADDEEEAPVAS